MTVLLVCFTAPAGAQSIAAPWPGHGHDAQHTGISHFPTQPLQRVLWQTPVDLNPQYRGTSLLIHYGSPVITRANSVIIPVKTGADDGFRVEARKSSDGSLLWTQATDYSVPPHNWGPPCGIALTPKNRVWIPGAGGTLHWRDAPDTATGATGRVAFYGMANYQAAPATFTTSVKINTPLTADRYGNVYFGFLVFGATVPALQSGIARVGVDGTGSWIAASAAAADPSISQVVGNCAPALSNDHRTLYVAVSRGNFSGGALVAVDSRTLAPMAHVALKDAKFPSNDALLPDDGTASPTIGPDGDVYMGVLENPFPSNHDRGWLLHFDKTLTQTKTAGAFGWDDTVSIVPSSCVPSYHGASRYLLLSKYNHYAGIGGDGVNKVAVLDPNSAMTDPVTGATIMNEILVKAGPTPDPDFVGSYPNAVREWCINTVVVDPATKSAVVHSEDGKIYRWDFATNAFTETLTITAGIYEAYTPTFSGPDGTVYVIANALLFAIGRNP